LPPQIPHACQIIFLSVVENLLKGSIATEADSQLSWSGGGAEHPHPTVVRFATSDEEDSFENNEEVTTTTTTTTAAAFLSITAFPIFGGNMWPVCGL